MRYLVYGLLISIACVGGNAFSAEPNSYKLHAVASISRLSDNDNDSPIFFNIGIQKHLTRNWVGGFNFGTNFSFVEFFDETGSLNQLKYVAGAHVGRYVYSSERLKTKLALESGFAGINARSNAIGFESAASEPVLFMEPKIIFESSKAFENKARVFLQISYLQTITDAILKDPNFPAFKTLKLTAGVFM